MRPKQQQQQQQQHNFYTGLQIEVIHRKAV